ncbi:hypothetical protein HPB51_012913 [Rhipicephalus microplus]|uniref:Uncharacterized protein n=1 Tax=Rhipicephalus microplus TaxID=6941 RepID=A0A9J6ETX8_RHIMP|nr:hypothetical protein HPB51_012913 [Rhipicephalus microplus]
MSRERPSTRSSKVRFLNLSAKGVTRSVSMEHLTASTTVFDEHETPWSMANADARPSVAAQTPEANTARPATDPAVSNSFSQQPEVDTPPGERMEEDTTLCDNTDNDAGDNSCKGIVPGLVPGTPSSTLVDELLTPGTQILQARMMGQTYVALVTFEGLKVPRYVRFYGAELRCYPHRPRQLVCKICHRLGHWADHCPTPHVLICATCGTDNPAPSHPCTPPCRSCDRSHHTSDPNCPRRARQTPNKAWVRKALKKEQRELQPPSTSTASKIWQRLDTHKSQLTGHCERVQSLARDPVTDHRPVPSLGRDPAEHQCGRPRNALLTKLHHPHNNPTRRPCLPTPLPRWPRPPRRRRESRRKKHPHRHLGRSPSIFHVTFECTANLFPPLPPLLRPLRKKELWDDALRDGPPEVLRAILQRVRHVAGVVLGTPN